MLAVIGGIGGAPLGPQSAAVGATLGSNIGVYMGAGLDYANSWLKTGKGDLLSLLNRAKEATMVNMTLHTLGISAKTVAKKVKMTIDELLGNGANSGLKYVKEVLDITDEEILETSEKFWSKINPKSPGYLDPNSAGGKLIATVYTNPALKSFVMKAAKDPTSGPQLIKFITSRVKDLLEKYRES